MLFEEHAVGGPISAVSRWTPRTLEAYLQAGGRPRWMDRIGEIEALTANARTRLRRARRALEAECAGDPALLAERWRAVAEAWDFEAVNRLIGQHNDWFPIERDLAMDPRTKDYVKIRGRSYRREPLGAAWILREFAP
ncbi:MAG TPA: hypothetical protein VD836_06335 [Solirubrobacteraceae bacterium]|nr:hypothetical protein [Solirubrobacteraceae bacterium]